LVKVVAELLLLRAQVLVVTPGNTHHQHMVAVVAVVHMVVQQQIGLHPEVADLQSDCQMQLRLQQQLAVAAGHMDNVVLAAED
jgi:hypothetical protein